MQKLSEKASIERPLYLPLTEEAVKKIYNEALRLLERSGMIVYSATAMDALEKAGAEIDRENRKARFPSAMVEDAIASTPASIKLAARDGKSDAVLEKNKVHYGTGGTAIYVMDPDTGEKRPSETKDVILNAKMIEKMDNVDVFTINVFPNDIKEKNHIDVNRFFHAFSNTRKHVMGGIYTLEGCMNVVKMAQEIAGGKEALRKDPFVSFITLLISPFKIDDNYGEMTCYLAKEGLPVVVPTEPICGTTSPITLAGNVLAHVAETLGGVTLVQAVNKGAPGICGSVGSITDLRTMNHLSGAVERAMINAGVAQVAQKLDLPLYSTAGTSDSKEFDVQAAYESAMSNLLVGMSGANYMHDAAGLTEFDLTVDYRKFVMDNEIIGMARRVLRGIEVNDEILAADLMIEKGPGQDFLAEQHTVDHMTGEFYDPTVSNRDKREYMKEKNAAEKVEGIIKEIRAVPDGGCLEEDLRAKITSMFPEIKTIQ
ncbi:MAG: trimethylamine methyltransferase family protein [Fibrobacterota bacterium]